MSQAAMRAAAVELLTDCATAASVKLQVYRGRPTSLYPPTAFVDGMHDRLDDFTENLYQHNPTIDVLCVWGLFDSGEAVDQRDAFVDAFHNYTRTRYHAASATSLIGPRQLDDLPAWVPDWMPPEKQLTYFATQIVLEGFETD